METWPREVCNEPARIEAEAVLQKALHPSLDELMLIYSFWSTKFPYWTVEQAAFLLMGSDPRLVAAYDLLPHQERKTFDLMTDILQRKFPTKVSPAELREYVPTIGVDNELLLSAIDYYCPSNQKPIRASSEKVAQNTRDDVFFGFGLANGYRSDKNNPAAGKMQRTLENVGISITDDTIRAHLDELAKIPRLTKVERAYRSSKNSI
jgi:hypothetical protein